LNTPDPTQQSPQPQAGVTLAETLRSLLLDGHDLQTIATEPFSPAPLAARSELAAWHQLRGRLDPLIEQGHSMSRFCFQPTFVHPNEEPVDLVALGAELGLQVTKRMVEGAACEGVVIELRAWLEKAEGPQRAILQQLEQQWWPRLTGLSDVDIQTGSRLMRKAIKSKKLTAKRDQLLARLSEQ
jgi:hypothetical protein